MNAFQNTAHSPRKLIYVETYDLSAVPECDPRQFFIDGYNGITRLWSNDCFKTKILSNASAMVSAPARQYQKAILGQSMWDSDILMELGHPPRLSVDEFLARLKDMLCQQPLGEPGILAHGTMFYVQCPDGTSVVVLVRFNKVPGSQKDPEWNFFCRDLNKPTGLWPTGNAVIALKGE